MRTCVALFFCLLLSFGFPRMARAETDPISVRFQTIDLDIGQSAEVSLPDKTPVSIRLIQIDETRDTIRHALRKAVATIEVNGERGKVTCGTYHLPVRLGGVRIDCPVVKGYVQKGRNPCAIDNDARLRIWPTEGPLLTPGTFRYPVAQRWFASATIMDNEIGDGESPSHRPIYYHEGYDFGGADQLVPLRAATDGLVVSSRGEKLEDLPPCVKPRGDVVYLRDRRGWLYRYSHLDSIDPAIELGKKVSIGQKLGVLGKKGASGGWAHLHFEMNRKFPNGRYGADSIYAFLLEAYRAEKALPLFACARPQKAAWVNEPVELDASTSWSEAGTDRLKFQWFFDDGTQASGPRVTKRYAKPGSYKETVRVTDAAGRVAYDFAEIRIINPDNPKAMPPNLHAAYWPTENLKVGEEIRFLARSFRPIGPDDYEEWDFGDGSPRVRVHSDGNQQGRHNPDGYAVTTHQFTKPGHYLVTVRCTNERGETAVDKLSVQISP